MAEGPVPASETEVRDFFDRWIGCANDGDWEGFSRLLHADAVLVDPMTPEPARGRSACVHRARAQYEPFPDGRTEMVGQPFVALDEPALAYRWCFTGTHLRPVVPPGFAPTGRTVVLEGASVLRFQDRQVVAVDLYFDSTAAARQLLAAPPAGSPLERVIVVAQRIRAKRSLRGRPRVVAPRLGRRR